MASSIIITDSEVLIEFQKSLSLLSEELHGIFDLMYDNMIKIQEFWQDTKYDEFVANYRPQIEKCEEISKRYDEWCKKVLQPTIDSVMGVVQTDVSANAGSSGVGTSVGVSSDGGADAAFASAAGVGIAGGAGAAFASVAGVGIAGDGKSKKDKPKRKTVDEMTDEELLGECTQDQIDEYNGLNVANKRKFLEDNVLVNRAREHGIETSNSITDQECNRVFSEDSVAYNYHGEISKNNEGYTVLLKKGYTTNDKQSKTISGEVTEGPLTLKGEAGVSLSFTEKNAFVGYGKCETGKLTLPNVNKMSNDKVILEVPDESRADINKRKKAINDKYQKCVYDFLSDPFRLHYADSQKVEYCRNERDNELTKLVNDIRKENNVRRSEGITPPPRPRESIATMACRLWYDENEKPIPIGKELKGEPGTPNAHTFKLDGTQIRALEKQQKNGEYYRAGTSKTGLPVGAQYQETTTKTTTETISYSAEVLVDCLEVEKKQ